MRKAAGVMLPRSASASTRSVAQSCPSSLLSMGKVIHALSYQGLVPLVKKVPSRTRDQSPVFLASVSASSTALTLTTGLCR